MKRKLVKMLAILIATTMMAAGCGKSSDTGMEYATEEAASTYDTGSYEAEGFNATPLRTMEKSAAMSDVEAVEEYEGSEDVAESKAAGESNDNSTNNSDSPEYDTSRKIIYTSYIDIETKKFDEDIAAIKKLLRANNGYYETSSVNGTAEYGGRTASYTARIPSKNYNDFMESIGNIGSVTYSNENVDDVTTNYVDVQTRLKTLNTKLERLLELEKQAKDVDELIKLEDRINEVTYDIESYTAQLRVYDDKIDYCTVNIDVDEVVTYTEPKKDTAWNRFAEAFKDSASGFIGFVQGLVIALIYVFPYVIVCGIIVLIVVMVVKKRNKVKKLQLEEKMKKLQEENQKENK